MVSAAYSQRSLGAPQRLKRMRAACKRRRRNSRPEVGERLLVWFSNDRRIKVRVLLIAVPTRASILPGSSAKARSKKPRACVRYWSVTPLVLQAISTQHQISMMRFDM